MGEQEIIEQLMALFEVMGERGGVVCWRDAAGEFSELVGGLELAGVFVLREVPGGLFSLKRQINEARPGTRILLYRAGEQAASVDWLQDVDVRAVPFSADRASGLLRELGADDTPQMRDVLEVCGKYLSRRGAIGRVAALRTGFGEPAELVLAVMAAALGARSCEVSEVVVAWLKGGDAARKKLRSAGLEGAFAALAQERCGCGDTERLGGHVLASALAASLPAGAAVAGLPVADEGVQRRLCREVFRTWLAQDAEGLLAFAGRAERELGVADAISAVPAGDLLWCEAFPCVDAALLKVCFTELASISCKPDELLGLARVRRGLAWASEFSACWRGVEAAARMRQFQVEHFSDAAAISAKEIWDEYTAVWCRVDALYRELQLALDEVVANPLYGLDDDFRGAADFIEGLYKEWFLRGQNIRWCSAIEDDLANKGEVKGLPRQVDFFPAEVEGSANRCRRAWVIVSDALRYEVAAEFAQNLERSTKGTAELVAVQGALPTKTKVGMPALLPHGVFEAVAGPKGGFTVHVDGAEVSSTGARQNALRRFSAGAVAVRFDDFLRKSDREARKQLVGDAGVVYIYHNTIDALGDDSQTERKVFQACGDAVEEISSLVKLLVKEFRAAEVLITADHGFLYTAKPLDESEHAAAADVAGKVVETSRRYIVTRPGAESNVLLRAKLPGKEGLEAFFPRECVRLRMPGAGENYVHGGISLQEICVPVVRFCNHRAGSRGFVATADATLSAVAVPSAVANPSFTVDLLQNEAMSGKVLPAEYEIYVEDASGRVVSGRSRVFADIDSTDASKRVAQARIDLLTSVSFNALETYSLVAKNIRTGNVDTLGELHIHLA